MRISFYLFFFLTVRISILFKYTDIFQIHFSKAMQKLPVGGRMVLLQTGPGDVSLRPVM